MEVCFSAACFADLARAGRVKPARYSREGHSRRAKGTHSSASVASCAWTAAMEGRKGSDSQVSRFVPVRSDPRKHRRRETATAARRTIAGSRTRNGGAGHEQKPENEREALGELHGFSVALVRSLYVRARGTGAAASADWGQMTRFRPCDWLMPHSTARGELARFDSRSNEDFGFHLPSAKRTEARRRPNRAV